MTRPPRNIVASVQARLVQRSHEFHVEHQLTLARFAGERLLYRLSASPHADRFIVKGAALLLVWFGDTIRPTKDVDLLGFGDVSADALRHIFADVCGVPSEDDGLTFVAESINVEPIRAQQEYGGMRITLTAMLGTTRIPMQVDVGTGDAVVPPPETIDYPGLLALPAARVRIYRPETSIAEKTEALVRLGLANSRMKDLFDIYTMAQRMSFEGESLRAAVVATFDRRQTALPVELPIALTDQFAQDIEKQRQWSAFVGRLGQNATPDLGGVVTVVREFLWPPLLAATHTASVAGSAAKWRWSWSPTRSWSHNAR